MKLTMTATTEKYGETLCMWQNESGQIFPVAQYETAVLDFDDFKTVYAGKSEFKSLTETELEDLFESIEAIEESDPGNKRGYRANGKRVLV